MDNSKKTTSGKEQDISEATNDLLNEGKKYANKLYQEGINRVSDAEDNVKEYSDELMKKVQQNPFTSILIAAGVGFLISTFLKK